ncbi:MAG: arginine--tRNA ligase [Candidatus Neomarinimicrobiota bacterium]|jgi:arginyl-tRNA synthetase|nr:arginine--tRNA ligase [Candidatus Neomarinimicrobiota bacterium]|tara:strand:+ start:3428 stop:5056 length:1629 start_codon:yes stop_codon:yes gene_type:complete
MKKMIIDQIRGMLKEALDTLGYSSTKLNISPSSNKEFGDFSSNIALSISKELSQNPLETAQKLKESMGDSSLEIDEITVSKPGFINFRISNKYYYDMLDQILKNSDFGKSGHGKGKTANVEFVSANPTGPLTVGHGRNAVLGDAVSNILEWNGFSVTREYYFNDAGRQMRVLSESVEARYFETLNKPSEFPEDGYQGSYINDIAKEMISEFGENLSSGDALFKQVPEKKIFQQIKNTLKKLGISFDQFSNEKTFYDNGDINRLLDELESNDLIYKKDGATWFKSSALGKEQDRVFIKGSGEPTYRVPDTAYHRNKIERKFDLIIDVFGADHMDTYPDVLIALQALGYKTDHIKVLLYQFVTLLRGGEKIKMSTRKANFITLDELIDEVGVDVVRYFFIMRGVNTHLNFDLDLAADQSEKNPVYYLQYAHARISNIIQRSGKANIEPLSYNSELLIHGQEIALLKKLEQFPGVVRASLSSLEPQTIANYLQDTAGNFHKYYAECRIIGNDENLTKARIALALATKKVLANGLGILGISAPEKM